MQPKQPCPNRVDDAYDNEGPPCGDEGRECSVCSAKPAADEAALYVAAPDLLAFVRLAAKILRGDILPADAKRLREAARDVLAKAEGAK